MSDLFDGEDRPTHSPDTTDADRDASTLLPQLLGFPFTRTLLTFTTAASVWLFSWPARHGLADSGIPMIAAATPGVLALFALLFASTATVAFVVYWARRFFA